MTSLLHNATTLLQRFRLLHNHTPKYLYEASKACDCHAPVFFTGQSLLIPTFFWCHWLRCEAAFCAAFCVWSASYFFLNSSSPRRLVWALSFLGSLFFLFATKYFSESRRLFQDRSVEVIEVFFHGLTILINHFWIAIWNEKLYSVNVIEGFNLKVWN